MAAVHALARRLPSLWRVHRAGLLGEGIKKHRTGILAYVATRLTNGLVEGINNHLGVIARRAYGFHTPGALISMLFLCCAGIQLNPSLL